MQIVENLQRELLLYTPQIYANIGLQHINSQVLNVFLFYNMKLNLYIFQ